MGLAWYQMMEGVPHDLKVALEKLRREDPTARLEINSSGICVFVADTRFFFVPWPEEFKEKV